MAPGDDIISIDSVLRAEDPVDNLRDWLRDAIEAGIPLPERACLATVSADGSPSARMVLVKSIADGELLFFTDYRSRKAGEIDANPCAAIVFYWHRLGRQVRVEGNASRLDSERSDRYFATRSRGSRISARASHQSAEVSSRSDLEDRWHEVARGFADREVTRPDHWGGFSILPERIEFWHERGDRLHDRIVFRRDSKRWVRSRLQP